MTRERDDAFGTRYPEYDVLDNWASPDWDDQTRAVVRARLEHVPPVRFFSEHEAALLLAVAGRIVPQPDRVPHEQVPVVPFIDDQLHEDRRDGYRYEGMPPQREAWRAGLAGIDATARALHHRDFIGLSGDEQDSVLQLVERGSPPGEPWSRVDARRFFASVLCNSIVKTYYSHPLAWNETGYHGPASPRGHVRKGRGDVDSWEPHERRARWSTG